MTKPTKIRADRAPFCVEGVRLPGYKGTYRAASADKQNSDDCTLFVSNKGHYVHIKDDVLVEVPDHTAY